MKKEILKKIKLPDKPGVYFFMKGSNILYIGKATSLRSRVKSYFSKDLIETRGPITLEMVYRADDIKWQTTDSVLEALILEASLIKKHQPNYNVREKDDKSWNHVCITAEKIPRIIVERGRNINFSDKKVRGIKYTNCYGPFTSGGDLIEALKLIRKIFPFLDDKSKNYYRFYRQVDLVPNITNTEGIKQYKKDIKNLKLFFEGKKKNILKNLQKQMSMYAKKQEFERAGEAKRQIFSLKHINDVALIKDSDEINSHLKNLVRIESYDIAHMGGKNMVGVMVVLEDGNVNKNEYRKFRIKTQKNTNDTGALLEVLERRLAHLEWSYPSLIVVDGSTAQINVTKALLARLNLSIPVVSVVKDEHHKPKDIMGDKEFAVKYKREILLANSEAHRFAITYHKKMRGKNFLK